MPLYDYSCLNCDHVFNALAGHDEQLICPNCQGETKRKFPLPIFVWGQGTGLSDVHDKEFTRMETNGEMMPQ